MRLLSNDTDEEPLMLADADAMELLLEHELDDEEDELDAAGGVQ